MSRNLGADISKTVRDRKMFQNFCFQNGGKNTTKVLDTSSCSWQEEIELICEKITRTRLRSQSSAPALRDIFFIPKSQVSSDRKRFEISEVLKFKATEIGRKFSQKHRTIVLSNGTS